MLGGVWYELMGEIVELDRTGATLRCRFCFLEILGWKLRTGRKGRLSWLELRALLGLIFFFQIQLDHLGDKRKRHCQRHIDVRCWRLDRQ